MWRKAEIKYLSIYTKSVAQLRRVGGGVQQRRRHRQEHRGGAVVARGQGWAPERSQAGDLKNRLRILVHLNKKMNSISLYVYCTFLSNQM